MRRENKGMEKQRESKKVDTNGKESNGNDRYNEGKATWRLNKGK